MWTRSSRAEVSKEDGNDRFKELGMCLQKEKGFIQFKFGKLLNCPNFDKTFKELFNYYDSNNDGELNRFDTMRMTEVGFFEEFDYADGRITFEEMRETMRKQLKWYCHIDTADESVEANMCSVIKDANAFKAFCKTLFAGVDSNKDGMLDRFDDKDVGSFEEFDYADGRVTLEEMMRTLKDQFQAIC